MTNVPTWRQLGKGEPITNLSAGTLLDGQVPKDVAGSIVGTFIDPPWDALTEFGVYAVDYDAGNDANGGFAKSTVMATACAAAGLVAKKTWSGTNGLLSILPKVGRGHRMVILFKNRAALANAAQTYLKDDAVTADSLFFEGFPGFFRIELLGTSDFSDSAQDRINSGAIQVSGPFTVTAAGSTSALTVGGGGLPTEANGVLRRVRFTGGTAANLNTVRGIYSITGGTDIVACQNFAAAPQNGDTFIIEDVGVQFQEVHLAPESPLVVRGIRSVTHFIAGYQMPIGTFGKAGSISFHFCVTGSGSQFIVGLWDLICQSVYQPGFASFDFPASFGASSNVGFGLRWGAPPSVQHIFRVAIDCSGVSSPIGSTALIVEVVMGAIGHGCVFLGAPYTFQACGLHAIQSANQFGCMFVLGNLGSTTFRRMRVDGRFTMLDTACMINGATITGTAGGDGAGLSLRGFGVNWKLTNIDGTSAAAVFGIIMLSNNANRCKVSLDSTVTTTGASGDIAITDVSGNQIKVTYASIAITNFIDDRQNEFASTDVASVVGQCFVFINGDGTAHAVGEVVRVSAANTVVRAQGDTAGHCDGALFVAVTTPAAGARGLYVPAAESAKWVLHSAAPTLSAVSYVAPATAGAGTTTAPAVGVDRKRELGVVARVSGSLGLVTGSPGNVSVLA